MLVLCVQFYVAESSLELLARHMLFLTLASEPLDRLGLQGHSLSHTHTHKSLLSPAVSVTYPCIVSLVHVCYCREK